MKVLLLGTGAVGEAYAVLCSRADPKGDWIEKLVLADFSEARAQEVAARVGGEARFPALRLDARDRDRVTETLRHWNVELVVNCCPQSFDEMVFDAAYAAGCHYMDLAMTLSQVHPEQPYRKTGLLLGDYQFAQHAAWEQKGLLALVGMGIDPGVSEVFAKYGEQELFDEIDEIAVRDGSNLSVEGVKYACAFSVWSVIEECLNPPVFWERDRGYYTAEPMSEPEIFDFPAGIGPLEVVSIEHEEVINLPRWINKGLKRVSFKISLGRDFMEALRLIKDLGMAGAEPIDVKGVRVSPRDMVEACLPDPAKIGPRMRGKICVGTRMTGKKERRQRDVYLYQVADNEACMERLQCQAVAAQTAVGPAVATELLAKGIWKGRGVLPPEAFAPHPFLERMAAYGFPWNMRDSWQEERGARREA